MIFKHTILTGLAFFCSAVSLSAQAGVLDNSFAGTGYRQIGFGSNYSENAEHVAILPDGKMLITGHGYDFNAPASSEYHLLMIRLLPDGDFDQTFGMDGILKYGRNPGEKETGGYTSIVLPDGKILTGGYTRINGLSTLSVFRFNTDGSFDTSFGSAGIAVADDLTQRSTAENLLIQPDGKIIAGGLQFDSNGNDGQTVLMRFNSNGTPDETFGAGGLTIIPNTKADKIIQLPDGHILTGGLMRVSALDNDALLTLVQPNGSPDLNFGNNGMMVRQYFPSHNERINDLALQPDQKIVILGDTRNINNLSPAEAFHTIERLNPDFSPDMTFGNNGQVFIPKENVSNQLENIAIQPDGKILMSGCTIGNNSQFLAIRLLPDGKIDSTFGVNGTAKVWVTENQCAVALALDVNANRYVQVGSGSYDDNSFMLVTKSKLGDLTIATNEPGDLLVSSVLVSPNPVTESIKLAFNLIEPGNLSISLYGLQGQLEKQFIDTRYFDAGEHQLNLPVDPDLPQGIWLLTLQTENGLVTTKVVK